MLFDMTQLTRPLVTLLAVSTLASPAAFADAAAPAAAAPAPAATPGKTTASAGLPRNLNFSLNAGGFFLPGGMEANIDQLNGGIVAWSGSLSHKFNSFPLIENIFTGTLGVYIKPKDVRAGVSHPYARIRAGLLYRYYFDHFDQSGSATFSWAANAGAGYRFAMSERFNLSVGAGAIYSDMIFNQNGQTGFHPNAELALGIAF